MQKNKFNPEKTLIAIDEYLSELSRRIHKEYDDKRKKKLMDKTNVFLDARTVIQSELNEF